MRNCKLKLTKPPPWGVLLGILGGVCRPILQILTLFQAKKSLTFHTRFHISSSSSSSSSLSLLFIQGKNNQAKYAIYNVLKMFTSCRINGN